MANQWIKTIVQDPDHPGELLLDLGDEICQQLGWQAGDTIQWLDNKDGTWTLQKKQQNPH
jgi:hypothetical protein